MKAIAKRSSVLLILLMFVGAAFAQRTITGVVYNNGEPAGGILVEAHKSNDSFYTSFDGQYEIQVTAKTKWLRFTFLDESKKLDIVENTNDVINFSWDGSEIPEGGDEAGVILKDLQQLQQEGDSEFLNNFSLYNEFFKQNDYESALPYWRKVSKTYPKSTVNIYLHGIKMMEAKMDEALMMETKLAYLDTIMQIYDKRMKYMDNVEQLLGLKAAKFLETIIKLDLSEDEYIEKLKEGYGYAEKSIETTGSKTYPAVIVLYMQTTKILYSLDEFERSIVFDNYEKAMTILGDQLLDEDMMENAEKAIPLVESIIESSGALDCSGLEDFYQPKFVEDPSNVDLIKKILRMFRAQDCESEFSIKLSEELYSLEPSSEAAFNMARLFLKKEEYDKAFEYYKEAYTSESDTEKKALYYYEAAGLSLQQSLLKQAVSFAKEAIKLKSDYCEAYMLIGEAYAQASKSFSDDEFQRSTVFWLAVDYFQKAANYANCSSDASSKVNFYQSYFPNKEEIFYQGLTVGNNHYLEGWINETTKVRAKE